MQLSEELFEQVKKTKSAEELLTLAKNNGYQMTEEEAKEYFEQLNSSGELADDELDSVAGGGGCGSDSSSTDYQTPESGCKHFNKKSRLYTGEPCCGQCNYYVPRIINIRGYKSQIHVCALQD